MGVVLQLHYVCIRFSLKTFLVQTYWVLDPYGLTRKVDPVDPAWGAQGF